MFLLRPLRPLKIFILCLYTLAAYTHQLGAMEQHQQDAPAPVPAEQAAAQEHNGTLQQVVEKLPRALFNLTVMPYLGTICHELGHGIAMIALADGFQEIVIGDPQRIVYHLPQQSPTWGPIYFGVPNERRRPLGLTYYNSGKKLTTLSPQGKSLISFAGPLAGLAPAHATLMLATDVKNPITALTTLAQHTLALDGHRQNIGTMIERVTSTMLLVEILLNFFYGFTPSHASAAGYNGDGYRGWVNLCQNTNRWFVNISELFTTLHQHIEPSFEVILNNQQNHIFVKLFIITPLSPILKSKLSLNDSQIACIENVVVKLTLVDQLLNQPTKGKCFVCLTFLCLTAINDSPRVKAHIKKITNHLRCPGLKRSGCFKKTTQAVKKLGYNVGTFLTTTFGTIDEEQIDG